MHVKDLFDLKGQVAIVTGGRGLYGASITAGLCEAGATVVIASRNGKLRCQGKIVFTKHVFALLVVIAVHSRPAVQRISRAPDGVLHIANAYSFNL